MILGTIVQTQTTEQIHKDFRMVFDFLKSIDLHAFCLNTEREALDSGRIVVAGYHYQGKLEKEARPEAHRKYIDIQLVVSGTERMGWSPLSSCKAVSVNYNEEKDVVFFEDPSSSYFTVSPGEFAVFFPEDVHAPGISEGKIEKIVAKVPV